MSDYKQNYSDSASDYINNIVPYSEKAQRDYNNSKKKEKKYNESWCKHKVNLNDIVEQFAPNSIGKTIGYKKVYDGERYQVVADMPAGYLRILDKKYNQYVKLDGKPGNMEETHFKIKKRGEM
jgi:hypothetical protein